jgi:HEAT repeat protein
MDDDTSAAALAALVTSPESNVRLFAAFELSAYQSSPKVIRALQAALDDTDPLVADAAASSLAALGEEGVFVELVKRLSQAKPESARDTAWAVAQLGMIYPVHRAEAMDSLVRYQRRARGSSRRHADALLTALKASESSNIPTPASFKTPKR